ncbi:D-alanyl-D-alanine carboxypeptidase [Streptomyces cyaneochromogenes]|uniref:D-alanyl-D-alanine carboxypeptidase n=1 Tax=Streptomyces cyaneochromogenes TaxID=2496836 RepID=UPI001E2EE6EF|nr:D-alanyl-D-alanine carboxypeptidase [Streptomyces cyaneochromogenes]
MAGESPDRSKQRESSAEPTSGSTGPVPDSTPEPPAPSRPDATERRDPRLAMARENSAPRKPATATSQGGVDTATRVLSRGELEAVRARLAEAEVAEDAVAGDARDAEGGSVRGAGSGDASPAAGSAGESAAESSEEAGVAAGSARSAKAGSAEAELDSGEGGDAVAADSAGAGAGGFEDASAVAEGSGDSEDVSVAAVDVESARTAGSSGEAEADAEAAGEVTDSEPAEDAPSEPAEASDAADAAEGESSQGADAVAPGDDRLRAAVAAWVASTDGEGDKAAAGADDGAKEAAAGDEAEADAEAADEATEVEPAEASGDLADETPEDASPGSDAPEDTPVDDAPSAAGGEDTEAVAPQGPPAVDDESGAGGAGGNTKAEGAAKAVDQPTAIFKAVRPAKPPVDHPTTTLKAPKPDGEDKAKAEGKAEAETPAERTSKFVALKPDIRQDAPKAPESPKAPETPKVPDTPRPPDVTAAIPQIGPERTTQQPLPPKPPLDLLAELTNTPPPPDTPVRTAIRRVKIWTPVVLLLAIVFAIAQAVRPLPTPALALTAEESYTFDGSQASLPWPTQGQGWMDVNGIGTMGNFGKQTPVAIGSVAKAMTAYVVLKDHALKSGEDGEKIQVDALAEKEGGYDQDGESTLNTVKEGDTITLHDAIAAIMIPSANNIARLLARWDAGTEKAFIEKMNATAKELGMTNTTYTDASGLKETTVSTAEDQVKLGNELVKIPALMEITSMGQWIDPSGRKWYNYNYLVPYNGAIGIKTGTTSAAGGNLLFAARKEVGGETVTLVGAILGQHKAPIIQTVNDVSKVAMLAAQDELTSAKILKKGDVVGYVDDGLGGRTPVVLTKDVTAVGWAGFKVKLSFDADDVPHTAKAGTKVGTLTVGDGTSGAVKVPVALQKDLAEPGFTDKLTRLG